MSSMVERVGKRLADACMKEFGSTWSNDVRERVARMAIEAMKDPPLDMLGAMYEAMFEDKWDCTQAPMVGAGWNAGIDAALYPLESISPGYSEQRLDFYRVRDAFSPGYTERRAGLKAGKDVG